jgi:hypothetical protein
MFDLGWGGWLGIIAGVAATGLALALPWAQGEWDRARLRTFLAEYGCQMHSAAWSPFGPGWLEKRGTLYFVLYRDPAGNEHESYLRAGMFSGVEITEGAIVHYAASPLQESPRS